MSVNHGLEPIISKRYVNPVYDWAHIRTELIQYNLILSQFDDYISESLTWTNMGIVMHIANMLQIKTKRKVDKETGFKGTDRLINICKENDCDCYLSGESGRKYMDISQFEHAGIELKFFNAKEEDKRPILEILK
jgi:hypothetical protein